MITHNTITALLWLVIFASGGVIGYLIAWWRLSYRLDECCDCCTCDDCEPEIAHQSDGIDWPAHEWTSVSLATSERRDDYHPGGPMRWGTDVHGNQYGQRDAVSAVRRTVVLEPGPTIYRALVPLDDESLYGPERPAKASESTWYRTTWLDLERRYPIHQDSSTGVLR